jgi:hypothetical protein
MVRQTTGVENACTQVIDHRDQFWIFAFLSSLFLFSLLRKFALQIMFPFSCYITIVNVSAVAETPEPITSPDDFTMDVSAREWRLVCVTVICFLLAVSLVHADRL